MKSWILMAAMMGLTGCATSTTPKSTTTAKERRADPTDVERPNMTAPAEPSKGAGEKPAAEPTNLAPAR